MTSLQVPRRRLTNEVHPVSGAIVLRGFGELDEQLVKALVAEATTLPTSVPMVLDLSELTLARTPVLRSLLKALQRSAGDLADRTVVVCTRLSARRMVRHAAGAVPVAVVATLDEALRACGEPSGTSVAPVSTRRDDGGGTRQGQRWFLSKGRPDRVARHGSEDDKRSG